MTFEPDAISAAIADADTQIERRRRAIEHHEVAARNALAALRGLGQHALVSRMLWDEQQETIAEIALSTGRRCPQPRRMELVR